MNMNFSMPIRVYYEDTDAGGVVYHARYLHFFERARTEFLRTLAFSQQNLREKINVVFVVRKAELDFLSPARLDDLLEVETQLIKITAASLLFKQLLKKGELILCEAIVKIACVDSNKLKPVAIPDVVKAAFLAKK